MELRKNNLVLVNGNVSIVRYYGEKGINPVRAGSETIDEYEWPEGIPLSHELLKAIGFEAGEVHVHSLDKTFPCYSKNGFSVAEKEDGFYHWLEIKEDTWFSLPMEKLSFLHEVQNLYLKNIKQELDIKISSITRSMLDKNSPLQNWKST